MCLIVFTSALSYDISWLLHCTHFHRTPSLFKVRAHPTSLPLHPPTLRRLWLISKEAADRLAEFEACDMVLLLDAVAGMCVADDALCRAVAETVAAKRAAYSAAQLAEVGSSLQRMGYTCQV